MLAEKLVRCYSPSGREEPVAELLSKEMEVRGYRVRVDAAGNVIGSIGRGPLRVDLVGHMDTVQGEIPVRIKDGVLYGRGSVDAKGALASFVEAASSFAGSTVLTVSVIGCVGEESDSRGARHLLKTRKAPDFVVIGEPSGCDAITLGYKGSLPFAYRLEKGRRHRGAPESTAAEEAVQFYQGLREAYPDGGPFFSRLSLRLVAFHTAFWNGHESVRMEIDARTPPEFDGARFRRKACELAGSASLDWDPHTPAVLSDKQTPLVRSFLAAIRERLGVRPRFTRKTGTSDMNLLASWEKPIVAYGPGDSSLDHTLDEHLEVAEYERAIAVGRGALERLARLELGGPEP